MAYTPASILPAPHSDTLAIRWLIILSLVCLLAFWVTIPLPRVDGQIIGSDGMYYYAYLPSLLIDGDLDFSNQYLYLRAYVINQGGDPIGPRTPTGLPANQYTVGTALLWMPFFLLAHALSLGMQALGLSVDTTGVGPLYQTIVLTGSILYGSGAILLSYRTARHSLGIAASFWASVTVLLGGNLIYYMTAEPSMSHTSSAFLAAAFFALWQHIGHGPRWAGAAYGALAGLLALVRPQMGLLLAIPYFLWFAEMLDKTQHRQDHALWRDYFISTLSAATAAVIVFAPQLFIWKQVFGDMLGTSYLAGGNSFYWLRPKLVETLVSSERGLLVWHPVFAFAIAGLILGVTRRRRWCIVGLATILVQWYIISSWHVWTQGDAFGGRMFIGCTACFVWGIGYLIEQLGHDLPFGALTLVVTAGVLVMLNGLFFVAYRFYLFAVTAPTWWDITSGRFVIPWRLATQILLR
jgi:hypothetical protein